jgi:UDP-GlcNAc:undecaprenyl-phosphate GlcNAc-1-phosphate transferase
MAELGIYLFAVSLGLTLLLTPPAMRLGRRWGILDHPGPRKVHADPVPLVGGWAIFAGLTLVVWGHIAVERLLGKHPSLTSLSPWIPYFSDRAPELGLKILPVYVGACLVFGMGVVDDVRGLSVRFRFVLQVGLAAALAALGLRPNLAVLPDWICGALGVLWIVGITNAFNFLDGLDGLCTGVALVAVGALQTFMLSYQQVNGFFFLAAFGGLLTGFLAFNWHPAKVFLGSGGSLLIGYLLGVFTIVATYAGPERGHWLSSILTPIFILAIPLYDTASVMTIRLLQKRPIAIGDQSHFHHRLLKLGFSHRQTVAFILFISMAIAVSATWLPGATPSQGLFILLQIGVIFSILVLAERVARRLLKRDPVPAERQDVPVDVP